MNGNVLDYLKLRVLAFYQEALMVKEGKMPPPRMCILYPTYACNHRCIGCDYAEMNRHGKSLSRGEFEHILKELVSMGIKSVEFCGGGEPTLHTYLPKAIDMLAESNIAFGLLTNGTMLSKEIQQKLVEHGSYCRISVEAGSRKIFDKYKNPAAENAGFDGVISNIREIVTMRNAGQQQSRLQISYKYSVDMNNYSDIFKAVTLAAKLEVDSVQLKCIRNVASEIREESIITKIRAELEKAKKIYPHFRIVDNLDKTYLRKCGCWLSVLQLTIDPYGDVYICCYYRHRIGKHRLGNIFSQSLKDIWYSEAHWSSIKIIDIAECNKYDCRFHFYNELMYDLVIKDSGQLCFI
jgi:radical SAM protein with 4Fe4S-binding SPASM domain